MKCPLAVFVPELGARSETFIRRHVRELLPGKTLVVGGRLSDGSARDWDADGPLVDNFGSLLAASANIRDKKRLVWRDWTRFSSRQQQKMTLGGVIGEWTLSGTLTPFLPFLRLGEWLHVGKEASFGLGRYTISTTDNADILNNFAEVRDCTEQHIAGTEKIT